MYNLLIVDDEDIIRNGLANTIDWAGMGFSVAGTASNGKEALILAEQFAPDVILADIRMPGMTGMELAAKIHEENPGIYIVILTGFDEFEYAKESIDYDVFSYLLKPYSNEKLAEVFAKLKSELDEKKNKEYISSKASQALLNGEFHTILTEGSISEDVLLFDRWLSEYKKLYLYIFVETDKRILDIFKKLDGEKVYTYAKKETEFWFVSEDSPGLLTRRLEGFRETGNYERSRYHALTTELYPGSINFQETCTGLRIKLKDLFFYCSAIWNINDACPLAGGEFKILSDFESAADKIFKAMATGSILNFDEIFNSELSRTKESYLLDKKEVMLKIKKDLDRMWRKVAEEGFLDDLQYGKMAVLLKQMDSISSIEEIYIRLSELLTEIFKSNGVKRVEISNSIVKQVVLIIKRSYMEDLTLDILAEELSITASYLSRLFKDKTGVNFKDYLKDFRINIAKNKLKHSDLKIYEIAEDIGYRDQAYFSDVFKKTVGCSPKEYRNRKGGMD